MSDIGGSLKKCYKCGKILDFNIGDAIPFSMTCESCGSWVHCCQNCDFFNDSQKSQCRETKAEFISDRQGRNTCDYFRFRKPRTLNESENQRNMRRANESRDRLHKMFGGWKSNYGGGKSDDGRGQSGNRRGGRSSDPRNKLEKLFGPPNNKPRPEQADPMEKFKSLFKDTGDSMSSGNDDDFSGDPEQAARRKLNKLFGNTPAKKKTPPRRDPRRKLEDLFRDPKKDTPEPDDKPKG